MVQVYREMDNHEDGHTYTSIGTVLHGLYQKYFLGYELQHPEVRGLVWSIRWFGRLVLVCCFIRLLEHDA